MAQKVIRNDFVAGEIAPELWGRHDVEMYYHGAARIENFIPRRTGGLRKRAGTELVWHLAGDSEREYRIIPYLYDKDNFQAYPRLGVGQICEGKWGGAVKGLQNFTGIRA